MLHVLFIEIGETNTYILNYVFYGLMMFMFIFN
jgi:hypothetical protein